MAIYRMQKCSSCERLILASKDNAECQRCVGRGSAQRAALALRLNEQASKLVAKTGFWRGFLERAIEHESNPQIGRVA